MPSINIVDRSRIQSQQIFLPGFPGSIDINTPDLQTIFFQGKFQRLIKCIHFLRYMQILQARLVDRPVKFQPQTGTQIKIVTGIRFYFHKLNRRSFRFVFPALLIVGLLFVFKCIAAGIGKGRQPTGTICPQVRKDNIQGIFFIHGRIFNPQSQCIVSGRMFQHIPILR